MSESVEILEFIKLFTDNNSDEINELNTTLFACGQCLTFAYTLKRVFASANLHIYGKGRICAGNNLDLIRTCILENMFNHYVVSNEWPLVYDIHGSYDVHDLIEEGDAVIMLTDTDIEEIKEKKELKDVKAFKQYIDADNTVVCDCYVFRQLTDSEIAIALSTKRTKLNDDVRSVLRRLGA